MLVVISDHYSTTVWVGVSGDIRPPQCQFGLVLVVISDHYSATVWVGVSGDTRPLQCHSLGWC